MYAKSWADLAVRAGGGARAVCEDGGEGEMGGGNISPLCLPCSHARSLSTQTHFDVAFEGFVLYFHETI